MGQIQSKFPQWLTPYVLQPAKRSAIQELPDWNTHDEFFRYTSRRWVFNEAEQLACRYVKFDMNELARITAESVGSQSCRKIDKYSEGQFNKVFLMTTEDGKEVVAKVPQPHAGRPHFMTASEVATMDYARNILGLPVPQTHAWSSRASTNSVGAEYIIMEKAPGVELASVWPGLLGKKRPELVTQIIQLQKRFTASPFPGIGSLYYAEDLDDGIPTILVETGSAKTASTAKKFVIGPINDHHWFDSGRGDVECDRGPWSSTEDYLVALGLHDLSYVKSDKKIPSPGIFAGPGAYQPSVARKIAALEDYIKVAPYLPPKDPLTIAPVLWHDDLHAGNIFVHPDDSSQITCIIDWQSSYISPLFRHTVRPDFLEYEGPKPLLGLEGEARKAPELPANFKELSPEDQKEAEALKRQQSLYKLFELYSAVENLSAYRALRHQETLRCILIECAAITSYHSEPNVEARLIEAVDNWEKLVGPEGPPCPLHYSVEDRAAQAEDFTRWSACLGLKDLVLQRLEAPLDWDGAVGVDEYTAAREKLHTVREGFLDLMANNDEERVEWARAWPFRDDEDTSE